MTPADYSHLYDQFRATAFRLECLQHYGVPGEDPAMRAFTDGTARPERSVRTSPWLQRIALDTIPVERGGRGKDWSRVRLVTWPLTTFTKQELLGYIESQAVGEAIWLADAAAVDYDGPDTWVFDLGLPSACAVRTYYSDEGTVAERELVTNSTELRRIAAVRAAALKVAVSLNEFLAREASHARA